MFQLSFDVEKKQQRQRLAIVKQLNSLKVPFESCRTENNYTLINA